MLRRNPFALLIAGALSIALLGPVSAADDTESTSALINALKKKKIKVRGVNVRKQASPGQSDFIKSLKNRKLRAISVEERTEVAKIVKESKAPSVDLEIQFAYNSATIQPKSVPLLIRLGKALGSADLQGATFLVAGHTDAKGSNSYNQTLSERRAAAVRNFLTNSFKLDSSALIAIGFGEEQLKLPGNPNSGENRRVQVVNLAQ